MLRIICVGNRFTVEDSVGPLVYDLLESGLAPPEIQVVDGGLMGLNLAPCFEGARRVVVVDRVVDLAEAEGMVLLDGDEVAARARGRYDHSSGLMYLLAVLDQVCEGPKPEVLLLGWEGIADEAGLLKMARSAVEVCLGGREAFQAGFFGGIE